ncbi:HNH endonuclease [Lentzea albidocapillata]|uniref:HNH endonuclease n=1 Tax=Lentzea albidocapillata TaxID=40571 RepID=UPI000B7CA556|nr:HNH endonuclease [Lentzea albidocapillata]
MARGRLHKRTAVTYVGTGVPREIAALRPHHEAASAAAARARELGFDIVVDRVDLYERDGWTCQLCDAPVDRDKAWPHPLSVTLDHIQPIARGGHHSGANLQTAHWECNLIKGAH